jgi:hypothetical protein
MWKLFLLACCLFAAVNWFLLPEFPILKEYISPLTFWSAFGAAAFCMVLSILFGKD